MNEDAAKFLWICLGGAVGTGARYALSTLCARTFGTGFPTGTLAINVAGSFLLGAIFEAGSETLSPTTRLALGTGVMGGFTTYSTFSYETFRHLEDGAWTVGLLNVATTVVGCLAACGLGVAAGRSLLGR